MGLSYSNKKKTNKIKTSPSCIPASGRCSLSGSVPPACHHPPRPVRVTLFPKPLNEWCFCGRVSWGFCRARRPECHRSRLIYPPPLSSCYAWSLNFPFLLFFLCFCSQIPPRPPPQHHHPAPFTSNFFPFFLFFAAVPFSLNMIHASTHATRFPRPELAPTLGNMSCWTDWPAPNVIHSSGATPENSSEAAAAPFPDLLLLCRAQT